MILAKQEAQMTPRNNQPNGRQLAAVIGRGSQDYCTSKPENEMLLSFWQSEHDRLVNQFGFDEQAACRGANMALENYEDMLH